MANKAKRDVKVEHLRKVRLFDGLSDRDLVRVTGLADEVAVPAGYVLVHEGAFGHEVFVLVEGEADVTADGRALAALGSGAVVGEMAVMDRGRRAATVVARTPLRMFVFESTSFVTLLEDFPIVARRVMSGMSHRLRAAQGTPAWEGHDDGHAAAEPSSPSRAGVGKRHGHWSTSSESRVPLRLAIVWSGGNRNGRLPCRGGLGPGTTHRWVW